MKYQYNVKKYMGGGRIITLAIFIKCASTSALVFKV